MKNNDKTKQVNFTIAIYICREYLRNKRNLSPPDVINLIEKHVLPVRPGRKDPRKVKTQASVIIPGISEPPARTLRATVPENERHIFR